MTLMRLIGWIVFLACLGSFGYLLQDNTLVLANVGMVMGSGLMAIVIGCLLWVTKN